MKFWAITIGDDGSGAGTLRDDIKNPVTARSNVGLYSLNQWYHSVMTYDNTTLKLFVNGMLIASQTGTNLYQLMAYQEYPWV